MSSSHFDQPIREWSTRKHAILTQYLPAFCTALSKQTHRGTLWYVDGYAGAGIYRSPDNPDDVGAPGSPVLAARITEKLKYDIRCLNVEENPGAFASLERETASFRHVTNINADFTKAIDQVLKIVGVGSAFFFLDPFGTKDLPMEGLIEKIAQRTQPTDILLRYDTEAVRRLAGSFEKDEINRQKNERILDKWFRGKLWQSILLNQSTGPKRDEELLNYYKRQIVTISGGRLSYAVEYPIRAIDGKIKYHMIFSSGNRLGIKIMSDILFKADEQFRVDQVLHNQKIREQELQLKLFEDPAPDPVTEEKAVETDIQRTILSIGRTVKQEWEFDELRTELILNHGWFARLPEKRFRTVCKILYKEAKIQRLSSGRAWERGTQFRISY